MKVRWRESAGKDLREIRAYIAQDNAVAARKVVKEIRQQVALLGKNPLIGRAGQVADTYELVISRYPPEDVVVPAVHAWRNCLPGKTLRHIPAAPDIPPGIAPHLVVLTVC